MMWMMVPCILIVIFAVFAGGGGFRSWPFLAIIGAMVAGHLWMMFRGHGHGSSDDNQHDMTDMKQASPENVSRADEKKDRSDHFCCH